MIKADLNPEILSTSDVSTLCSGKGTWRGIRDSRTLQKKIPLPSQRTTLATRDKSRGDGRGKRKNLETRAEVDNNKQTKRKRERENINK